MVMEVETVSSGIPWKAAPYREGHNRYADAADLAGRARMIRIQPDLCGQIKCDG